MMYAVSIRQPFASLILAGIKRYEVRSWHPETTGWLLVHASTNTGLSQREVNADPYITKAIKKAGLENRRAWQRGAIIGAMEYKGQTTQPVKFTKIDNALCASECDQCLWIIGDTITFDEPIPCKGELGLFMPDRSVIASVRRYVDITLP
jgi:hypothetical protein